MNAVRTSAILVSFAFAASALAEEPAHHWSYSGATGPAHWGELETEYESCGLGRTQSPVDIRTKTVHVADLPHIVFDCQVSPLRIIDNGHTVQMNYAPGSFITVADARYELVQLHFHHPSEEKVNGRSYDMVAHLVHKDADGKLAVIAVPLSKGEDNALVATVWRNLPREKGTEKQVESVTINASDLLPAKRAYYTLDGSLTTPPCSEGVRWFVLKTPTHVSASEIAVFAKLYPMNARPVQPLNGREIVSSK